MSLRIYAQSQAADNGKTETGQFGPAGRLPPAVKCASGCRQWPERLIPYAAGGQRYIKAGRTADIFKGGYAGLSRTKGQNPFPEGETIPFRVNCRPLLHQSRRYFESPDLPILFRASKHS